MPPSSVSFVSPPPRRQLSNPDPGAPNIPPPERPPPINPERPPQKEPPPEVIPEQPPVELPPTDPTPIPTRVPPQARIAPQAIAIWKLRYNEASLN